MSELNAGWMMTRRFFFFPHGREKPPAKKLTPRAAPWRVPCAISGDLVTATTVGRAHGTIMGDGYQLCGHSPMIGGNQDPCVFSEPLAGLHSFCRIVHRQGRDNDVRELSGKHSNLLPSVVVPGDIVFYGKPSLRDFIAIDTVLTVDSTAIFADVAKTVSTTSDAWTYNLSDACANGSHAGADHQLVIVGRREPTLAAVAALATSFVPPAQRDENGRLRVLRVVRSDLGDEFDSLMGVLEKSMFTGSGPMKNKGYVCELPALVGRKLATAILDQSRRTEAQGVFVPPLRPRGNPLRFGADGCIRAQAEHLQRLRF